MTSPPSFIIHFLILLRISELDLNAVRQMYVSYLGSVYTPYHLRGEAKQRQSISPWMRLPPSTHDQSSIDVERLAGHKA